MERAASRIIVVISKVSWFDRRPFLRPDLQAHKSAARSGGQGWPQATAEGGAKRP